MHERFTAAQPWLSALARLFLAGVFALAAWPKLFDPDGTVRSVRAYRLVPETFVHVFAYGLPLFELALCILLLLGLGTRWTAVVTALLLTVFICGIASAWARGLRIECGCFGAAAEGKVENPVPGYIRRIAEDVGFLTVAVFLARWPRSRFALDSLLWPAEPDTADVDEAPAADVPAQT